MARTAEVVRETKETQIRVAIDLDGSGKSKIATGVGFFDHMLESFARHGGFDLDVETRGDLPIDMHHQVEDTGNVSG
ncbi:MAG: imidazoleglycerol-phosphate dehydratase, partial [Ignavibacteriales bacterium]